jgi:hypothetical protein
MFLEAKSNRLNRRENLPNYWQDFDCDVFTQTNFMPTETRIVKPGPNKRTVRTDKGKPLKVPAHWKLLKPGDAGATRRVKAAGPSWTVKAKRGRRVISLGVLADAKTIDRVVEELTAERSTDAYAKKQASAKRSRDKKQQKYVEEFTTAVFDFLDFHTSHKALANRMATAIAEHATPVGSGTVARTSRIPVERRAESAVIAWMRHQTTAYDDMTIPRVKGKRREVRRMLAQQSRKLLDGYRNGDKVKNCLLKAALVSKSK